MELQLGDLKQAQGIILILSPYCVRWRMVDVTYSCLVLYKGLLYIYQCHVNTI